MGCWFRRGGTGDYLGSDSDGLSLSNCLAEVASAAHDLNLHNIRLQSEIIGELEGHKLSWNEL